MLNDREQKQKPQEKKGMGQDKRTSRTINSGRKWTKKVRYKIMFASEKNYKSSEYMENIETRKDIEGKQRISRSRC